MPKFRSGRAIVQFDVKKVNSRSRIEADFLVTIGGNVGYKFEATNYSCPSNWSEEKIAQDMLEWANDLASDNDLYDAMEYDRTDGDFAIPMVEKVEAECLNCSHKQEIRSSNTFIDHLGKFTVCEDCGGSYDI